MVTTVVLGKNHPPSFCFHSFVIPRFLIYFCSVFCFTSLTLSPAPGLVADVGHVQKECFVDRRGPTARDIEDARIEIRSQDKNYGWCYWHGLRLLSWGSLVLGCSTLGLLLRISRERAAQVQGRQTFSLLALFFFFLFMLKIRMMKRASPTGIYM